MPSWFERYLLVLFDEDDDDRLRGLACGDDPLPEPPIRFVPGDEKVVAAEQQLGVMSSTYSSVLGMMSLDTAGYDVISTRMWHTRLWPN